VGETRSIVKFKQCFCLEGSVLFSVCLDPPYISVELKVLCWNTVCHFLGFVANIRLEICRVSAVESARLGGLFIYKII
jgi:hypothetical protein